MAPKKSLTRLILSVFPERHPVIFFESFLQPKSSSERVVTSKCKSYKYIHGKKVHKYNCVINTLKHAGLVPIKGGIDNRKFVLYWNGHEDADDLKDMLATQKVNHFPLSWHLGRKDLLWTHINRMNRSFPGSFTFTPTSFLLPADEAAFARAREDKPNALWISKPANSSCGRGIHVFKSDSPFKPKQGIIQKYIKKPLLLEDRKFDLRIYVLVTSFDPLKIYIYEEGLVRRATQQYTTSSSSLKTQCIHLTNYSVNKHSAAYVKAEVDSDEDSDTTASATAPATSKWSLADLRRHLNSIGVDFGEIFEKIKALAVKTIIAAEPVLCSALHRSCNLGSCSDMGLSPYQGCFEIYGFDVLIDSKLRPWLLEVNVEPSLSSSSPLDKRIKTALVADTLLCAGVRVAPSMNFRRAKNVLAIKGEGVGGFGDDEWEIVKDAADEWMRSGGWIPAFPVAATVEKYSQLIGTKRYSNAVLERWVLAGGMTLLEPMMKFTQKY